jgi:hypothetical protein
LVDDALKSTRVGAPVGSVGVHEKDAVGATALELAAACTTGTLTSARMPARCADTMAPFRHAFGSFASLDEDDRKAVPRALMWR